MISRKSNEGRKVITAIIPAGRKTYNIKYLQRFITLFVSVCFTLLLISSCSLFPSRPGPISVTTEVSPDSVYSGNDVTLTVTVQNYGGAVRIERVHLKEEWISGWMEGNSSDLDVNPSVSVIEANSSAIVYKLITPVYNTGPDNVMLRETITVYSDGGEESDSDTFTIVSPNAAVSVVPKSETVLGISQAIGEE